MCYITYKKLAHRTDFTAHEHLTSTWVERSVLILSQTRFATCCTIFTVIRPMIYLPLKLE
jgi:hypothetical protein